MRSFARLGPCALTCLRSPIFCASSPLKGPFASVSPDDLSVALSQSATRRLSTIPHTEPDEAYRIAIQEMWVQTRQQKRLASKIEYALNAELLNRNALREYFVGECGFQIIEVRLSRDHMKAFILWSAYPAQIENAQIALTRNLALLRSAVAQRIQTRAVPRLEFRQNKLTAEQATLENLLDNLKVEREQEEQEHEQEETNPSIESESDTPAADASERPVK